MKYVFEDSVFHSNTA